MKILDKYKRPFYKVFIFLSEDTMKKIFLLLFFLLLCNIIFSITADGYAFLENQTNHDSIKVFFERIVPNILTDSTYTYSSGYRNIIIASGIYDITYSKDNYHPVIGDEEK